MSEGRPKEYKSRTIFTVSAEAQVLMAFKEIAKKEGKPYGRILQELMADYVKKHFNGNPAFALDECVKAPDFMAFPTLGENPDMKYLREVDDKSLRIVRGQAEAWARKAEEEERRRERL